ncbi:hypothetical protein PTSG_07348 [Salpingoeca rosetta]|uniref:Transmembrane protein n=1 Tax=Salpingoeca rosetta (strain ATCC 50818 / BSB-021) TaxID=946362 RepID=F2UJ57_SALR5|nr:uncharacterized protein PTSG_07348 [Salpingoeca rosetta]EGD77005.1 hypothetical protein PTSG_07348 [Salpingoeca rosetta]|eukprot:XP_004990845.1 hypothetical protein PTSG_07348 [Salpingoeca rosetta]
MDEGDWVSWWRAMFGLGGELIVFLYMPGLLLWAILLGLKVDGYLETSWWNVTIPMFLATGVTAYTLLVAAARMWRARGKRFARGKGLFAFAQLCNLLVFVFFVRLCVHLEDGSDGYGAPAAPLITLAACCAARLFIR